MSVNSLCRPRVAITFCVLVLLVPLNGAESKAGAEQARQEWMTGYLKLEHANKAVAEERTASALQLFEEALAVFQQVRDSAPDWQPQLVNYRITFCEERIQALRETAALGLEKMSPQQLRSEIQRLRQELSGPKARIEQLEAEVERLTARTASTNSARELAEERAAKAEADRRADAAQITDLSRRAEELAASLAQRNETVKTLEDAVANTATLSATVAELERRAKAGADATRRCEALEIQLAELEKERQRLASVAEDLDRTERERDAMRGERDHAVETAAESNASLREEEMARKVVLAKLAFMQKQADAAETERLRLEKECERLADLCQNTKTVVDQAEKLKAELVATRQQAAMDRAAVDDKLRRAETADADIQDLRVKVATLAEQLAVARGADIEELEHRLAETEKRLNETLESQRLTEEKLAAVSVKESELQREKAERQAHEAASAAQAEARSTDIAAGMARVREAMASGQEEQAQRLLRAVVERDPENAEALHQLGAVLANAGNDLAAETVLSQALRRQPDDPDVLLRLGVVLLRQEKTRQATAILLQGTQVAPEQPQMQHFLGLALAQLGWRTAAEATLEKAFTLDPSQAATAYNLAIILASANPQRLAEARTWYDKAVSLGAARDAQLEHALEDSRP